MWWGWLLNLFTTKAVPAVKHAVWRTISVVCVLLVIGGLVWAIYVAFVKPNTKPNPTTTQNAGSITNYNYQIKLGFGSCARLPMATDKK